MKLTFNQLIKELHKYNSVEKYLKQNPKINYDSEFAHQFIISLNPKQRQLLLLPYINLKDASPTFHATDIFSDNDKIKFKVNRHNRYTYPIMHNHDFYEIEYTLEGEYTQTIGSQRYQMSTGDISIIPPFIYHKSKVNNSSIVLNYLIDADTFHNIIFNQFITYTNEPTRFQKFFNTDFKNQRISNFYIFQTSGDEQIRQLLLKTYLEALNKDECYETILEANLLLLFSLLLRNYSQNVITSKNTAYSSRDLQLLHLINQKFDTITLDQLSQQTNYSPHYITTLIKSITGKSFKSIPSLLR